MSPFRRGRSARFPNVTSQLSGVVGMDAMEADVMGEDKQWVDRGVRGRVYEPLFPITLELDDVAEPKPHGAPPVV